LRKRHTLKETIAAHCAILLNCHGFRWVFEQIEVQMMKRDANTIEVIISAILFLRKRGANRIDFSQAQHERLFPRVNRLVRAPKGAGNNIVGQDYEKISLGGSVVGLDRTFRRGMGG
jgi:hypothetical protein